MSAKEALVIILSRLRVRERHKLLIALFAAISLSIFAYELGGVYSKSASWILAIFCGVGALILALRMSPIKEKTESDAAAYLDEALKLKDRAASFVGLLGEEGGAKSLIESQLLERIKGVNLSNLVVLPLTRLERRGIGIGVLSLVLAAAFFFMPDASPKSAAEAAINNLLRSEPELPERVTQSLKELKKALRENEPTGEEVRGAIDKARQEIEEARAAKEKTASDKTVSPDAQGEKSDTSKSNPQGAPSPSPTMTPEPQKSSEAESGKSEEESENPEQNSAQSSSKSDSDGQGKKGEGADKKDSANGGQDSKDQQKNAGEGQDQSKDDKQAGGGKGDKEDSKKSGQGSGGSDSKPESNSKGDTKGGEGSEAKGEQSQKDKESQSGKSGASGDQQKKDSALDKAQDALKKIEKSLNQNQKQKEGSQGEDQNQAGEKESKSQSSASGKEGSKEGQKGGSSPKESREGDKTKNADDKKAEQGGQQADESKEQGQSERAAKSSIPNLSDTGQKQSPFSDAAKPGVDGPKEFKDSEINNANEKYDTRFAERDGSRELNPNEAKPQIELGERKLAKPEASKESSEQAIPPEYRDLID